LNNNYALTFENECSEKTSGDLNLTFVQGIISYLNKDEQLTIVPYTLLNK
jgi:hypothetical protein